MIQRLILIGPPGAGKGTQALKICAALSVPHISTGDILRKEVADKSPLGLEAKRYMDAGELVPDSTILGVIETRLSRPDCASGFLFDGFPRTVAQAEGLDLLLKRLGISLSSVVNLVVSESDLLQRLLKRGQESGRSDDNEEVISNRIRVFKEQTAPLIEYYSKAGLLLDINGIGSIDEIFEQIIGKLKKS